VGYIDLLGPIHSHPPIPRSGNPALDTEAVIADMYPSSGDWQEMEREALAVLQAGGDPSQLSMYIVDEYGSLRKFEWTDRAIYDVPLWVLLQQYPGVLPRPPLPDPIILSKFCGF
jgi:hypothetical protein